MQFSILSVLVLAAALPSAFAAPAAAPVADATPLEKRCDQNRFTVCNTLCGLSCKPPIGCPTCNQFCFLDCARGCGKLS